jgi:hypothetical protein
MATRLRDGRQWCLPLMTRIMRFLYTCYATQSRVKGGRKCLQRFAAGSDWSACIYSPSLEAE